MNHSSNNSLYSHNNPRSSSNNSRQSSARSLQRKNSQNSKESSSQKSLRSHRSQSGQQQQQSQQQQSGQGTDLSSYPAWIDTWCVTPVVTIVQVLYELGPVYYQAGIEWATETWQHRKLVIQEVVLLHLLLLISHIDWQLLAVALIRALPTNLQRLGEVAVLWSILSAVHWHYKSQHVMTPPPVCVVMGYGPGVGAAVARKWANEGYRVALLSRSLEKVQSAAKELPNQAQGYACDVTQPAQIQSTVTAIQQDLGPISCLIYNAGNGVFKSWSTLEADEFTQGFQTNVGGLLAATQSIVPGMLERGQGGQVLVTGATASLRGKPLTAGFAPHKGAQRLLCQSLARDLHPQGIHVGYFIVDGRIGTAGDPDDVTQLNPDSIAQTYWNVATQDKSCWSFETEIRPSAESW